MEDAEYKKKITKWTEDWLIEQSEVISELSPVQIEEMYARFTKKIINAEVNDTGDITRMLVILGLLSCRKVEIAAQMAKPRVPSGFKDLLQ